MTSELFAHDGPGERPSAGRLGALAAVTPIAMYGAWIGVSGWGGTGGEFWLATTQIALGAIAAGWLVGGRVGRSVPRGVIGVVAYSLVARLVLLPIHVVGSTWGDLRAGRLSDPVEIVLAIGGYLLYGVISASYSVLFLLPFGAGWMLTFLILRRAAER